MNFTYLLVDLFTVAVPLVFSFHSKINFAVKWKEFLIANLLVAIPFLLWDSWFTKIGVWGFNSKYVVGLYLGNLPLEEVLFFICIPYSCIFTFHCVALFLPKKRDPLLQQSLTAILAVSFLIAGVMNSDKYYTAVSCILAAAALMVFQFLLKANWLIPFYVSFVILLLPFFLVNGILTGTGLEEPVVWYNEQEIIGPRLFTIPLEDISYALALLLLNAGVFKILESRLPGRDQNSKSEVNRTLYI